MAIKDGKILDVGPGRAVTGAEEVDATGKLLWPFKTAGRIYSPATIGPDGTVFVGTMRPDNCLYALDGASGRLKWKGCGVKGGGQMHSGAAVGEQCWRDVLDATGYGWLLADRELPRVKVTPAQEQAGHRARHGRSPRRNSRVAHLPLCHSFFEVSP